METTILSSQAPSNFSSPNLVYWKVYSKKQWIPQILQCKFLRNLKQVSTLKLYVVLQLVCCLAINMDLVALQTVS